MSTPPDDNSIQQIHESGKQLVLSTTGGGSGAIGALLGVPGASASVLEGVVPYAAEALAQWLRAPVDQACSERTARAMAMASFERGRALSHAPPKQLRGIGATASLATTRPKRGPHRVHVAWQSAERTVSLSCELVKERRTRAEEEAIATQMILDAVAEACDVPSGNGPSIEEPIARREQRAPVEWTALLLGTRTAVFLPAGGSPTDIADVKVVFPGAFNPLHPGHARMAAVASRWCRAPVTWELSVTNVDKRPLDFIEIHDRLAGLAGRPVLLTSTPTFVQKAGVTPGAVFVVGADTIERIGEARYYGNNPARRDAAIAEIASHGCRFLVFGRLSEGEFRLLRDCQLPVALRALCDEVPESEFRDDVSSTELRSGE